MVYLIFDYLILSTSTSHQQHMAGLFHPNMTLNRRQPHTLCMKPRSSTADLL